MLAKHQGALSKVLLSTGLETAGESSLHRHDYFIPLGKVGQEDTHVLRNEAQLSSGRS